MNHQRKPTKTPRRRVRSANTVASTASNPPQRFAIVIECADEHEQLQMLARFQSESIKCRALIV
jgi:hypothetical protein